MAINESGRLLNVVVKELDQDFLVIEQLSATEGLSQLFEFDLELLHEETKKSNKPTPVDPHDVLGQPMTVRVKQEDGTERYFNGICARFTQGQRDQWFTHYQATLVPHVWFLTQIARSRIFQNTSVDNILRKVFKGFEVDYEIGSFEPRNYCVQYRETDWDFAARLMEEEGIYFYFEHTKNAHRMILGNTPDSHRECPSKSTLPFHLDKGELGEKWTGAVLGWFVDNNLRTGKYELWDYNFQLPTNRLDAIQLGRFPIGGNEKVEIYDFPGGYAKRFDGIDSGGAEHEDVLQKVFDDRKRTVKIRQEEIDAGYKTIRSVSDCCSLTAGYRFQLSKHPLAENNINHVIVTARHEAMQTPGYTSSEILPTPYTIEFTCIPHGSDDAAPYRPPRTTAKPIVHGSHTAVVSGPGGEEIYTDKYGRVKVQFKWDRTQKFDAESSAWVRVAQGWAGNKWGIMFIPRIGMEVVVQFLEGDPDQPIITGCVYNPTTMPPYDLPDEKTKSTLKSNSSQGGGGFNEFRFEDKSGEEQIFIHGEKNLDIRIKNDAKQIIQNDHHVIVENNEYEKVKGDLHLKVVGDKKEKVDGSVSLDVGSNLQEKAGQKYAMDAGQEIHLKGGMKVVIEAGMQLSLKGPGGFVDIGPSGVTIQGTMVLINSGGAAGSGSGSSPDAPTDPTEADDANAGEKTEGPPPPPEAPEEYSPQAEAMAGAADKGTPYTSSGSGSGGGDKGGGSSDSGSGGGGGDKGGGSSDSGSGGGKGGNVW
jgi:type VI secretion system secreted protein VgrG